MAYEFNGRKYEKASSHQKEWGTRLIAELALKGAEHVLDLGCGDGSLTQQIAQLLPQGKVVGIDASQGMIDVAQPKSCNNLEFQVMNINALSFDNEFDVVFSNAALHWVKEHVLLLLNVYRALRPGGQVRFNFAGDGNCSHFFKVIREAIDLDQFNSFFSDFEWPWYMPTVEAYTALVQDSDFKFSKVWGANADRYFQDKETMIQWIDQPSLVPFYPYLPREHHHTFRDYVITRMIEETSQPDGQCFETFRRINLLAEK